jgi:signal peptidase I
MNSVSTASIYPLLSLTKARKILKASYAFYKKQGKELPPIDRKAFEQDLENCDKAILNGDQEQASLLAHQLEQFTQTRFKKSVGSYLLELITALIVALIIALIVRQMWFEPYEIPTGSMRPTFKEKDLVAVSKAQFGINIPLKTDHFYFDPNLVQRSSVVVWSGDGVPVHDPDTTYFGIFPYKKRYIKRLIGKPGDTLYFYGGKIYGIDREGRPIEDLDGPWLDRLEHIPFMSFEGEISTPDPDVIQFEQMHQPVGRLTFSAKGAQGEVYNGTEWVKDQPQAQTAPHDTIKTYSDFYGIRNFAMARLLTPQELKQYSPLNTRPLDEGILYLQLIHTPSLNYPKPLIQAENSHFELALSPFTTVIPLQQKHLDAIMQNMYTARFEVKDGRAKRYSANSHPFSRYNPRFSGAPDGTYEYYYGKAYKIGFGGTAHELPSTSPLYNRRPDFIQALYNQGIDFHTLFNPSSQNTSHFPHRYAYFRDGDLYLLGAPILRKDDPALLAFHQREKQRETQSTSSRPYVAFKDYGPPFKEGKLDSDFIKTFGIKVAPKSYLVLGDNHAMSADSRVFGFVPEENLQGRPIVILWPLGSRWGIPNQRPYPLFVLPRMIVWATALLILAAFYAYYRWNLKRPIFKRIAY